MLVSIIMPCHNGAPFIADAIRSVQSQTFADWELLVIDDCSSDDSADIVKALAEKDGRIRLLRTERSTGLPATPRNVGIRAARGRYIAFLDCDDEWLPTKLARQVPLFGTRNAAVVFSWYGKMDGAGNYGCNAVSSPAFVSYASMLDGNRIGNLTGIYDTDRCGKVLQREIRHEDYVMWLEILARGFFAVSTNSVEAVYRESRSSVSGSKLRVLPWQWRILRKELGLPPLRAAKHFLSYAAGGLLKFLK